MEPPTTGLEPVDELIGGLRIGDNVVVQAAEIDDAVPLVSAALRSSVGNDRLVYASLRDAPQVVHQRYRGSWDSERFVLLDYRDAPDEHDSTPAGMRIERPPDTIDPAAIGRALLRIGRDWGPGTRYVIDGLTDVQRRWGDEAVLDLFLSTCPALYQQRTIAYWTLQPDAHSRRSLTRLAEITQVVLDLHTEDGELVVELRKAAGRPAHLRGGRIYLNIGDHGVSVVRRLVGTRERAGQLIRQRRQTLGLSQAELARRVDITPSALSQAERGLHGLSGEVLTRVWEAMDVPFGPDAQAVRPPLEVFRRGRSLESVGNGLSVDTVVQLPDLSAHLVLISPGSSGTGGPFSTKQRELVVVLDGVLELRVGQTTETLQPGDAALITGEPIAGWSNPGIENAHVLWTLTP